jgi:hypothetical protein
MRPLAAILLLVAAVIQLLLGGVLVMSSRYRPVPGAPSSGPAAAASAAEQPSGGRHLALGIVGLALGAAQLVGGILAFRRRARVAVLGICAAGALGLGVLMLVEGPIAVALIATVLLVLAFAGFLASRGFSRAAPEAER